MAATPTTAISFQNFFSATLTADITTTSTDIFLDTIPNGSEGFLVIDPLSSSNHEVIYYNSKTSTKVTCPSVVDGRGQDDTTAVAHLTGTTVIMAPVAAYYETLLSLFTTTPQGWSSLAGTFTAPVYNGNRSYTFSTSTDQSAVVSPGMRLRTTRTVAAPTQCTSLNGTTQYYSKTSPAGMTFTNNFVAGAWVKLTSYAAIASIISRYNGTSGWDLQIDTSGRLILAGYNAGSGNVSYIQSSQAVPLNRWVHVAGQLDMSTFTATPTTSYLMFDGVDVPATVTRVGTNPTALVQAGNLEVGSRNAGTQFFPGKIAQAFVTSAKVTQATIRSNYISQSISPTETSLISAYSFNNSINDLNANANNLTANGSAVATNADSPFGGQAGGTISSTLDYAIVTAVTSSTLTVQVPEGCAIPTSGGISAVSYSTQKCPFGFPDDEDKWSIYSNSLARMDNGSTVNGTTANSGNWQILAPVGAWRGSLEGPMYINRGVAGTTDTRCNISTTAAGTTAIPNGLFNTFFYANIDASMWTRKEFNYTTATAQSLYVNLKNASGVTYSSMGWLCDFGQGTLMLRNAYL